jgi:hypothetical protein
MEILTENSRESSQGPQNPDTKLTLQRATNANTLPTHPSRQNFSQLHRNTSAKQHLSEDNILNVAKQLRHDMKTYTDQ